MWEKRVFVCLFVVGVSSFFSLAHVTMFWRRSTTQHPALGCHFLWMLQGLASLCLVFQCPAWNTQPLKVSVLSATSNMCLVLYILTTFKVISKQISTHSDFIVLPQWEMLALDLISHSVTLSWCWENQSLPYILVIPYPCKAVQSNILLRD